MTPRRSSEFIFYRRGQVLIVTFWMIALVSVATGVLMMRATHEARLSRIPLEVVQREAIVQAAVQQAIALLQRDEDLAVDHLGESWATGEEGGQPVLEHIAVGPGIFTAGLIDEERKINLRHASTGVLARLIGLVGPPETDPQELAEAIRDWRTADEPEIGVCAEPQRCHNGLFDSVDELRLVPGMTPELFDALVPYVTVYGGPASNVNTADPLVLRAWDIPEEQVGKIVTQRQSPPFTTSYPGLSAQSTAFTVMVEAWIPTLSLRTRLHAVIDRDGNILAWLPQ